MRWRAAILLALWTVSPWVTPMAVPREEPVPPRPSGPEGPEPVVLSLAECIQMALDRNLDISVQSLSPIRFEALLGMQEAAFEPILTGNALTSDVSAQSLNEFGLPRSFDTRTHEYRVGLEDPLSTGGFYRLDVTARDIELETLTFLPGGLTAPINTTETQTGVTLTFIQPLLRNFGQEATQWRVEVARNDLSVSASAFRQSVMATVAEAERAYWELDYALRELETAEASMARALVFLEQNRIKVSEGILARADITQTEVQVAQREQELVVARSAVLDAEDELKRVLGYTLETPDWERPIRPVERLGLPEAAPVLDTVLDEAGTNRPDLEQARLRIQSAEMELRHWENQRRWGLDFEGSLGYQGVDFDEFLIDPNTGVLQGIGQKSSYQDAFDALRDGDLPSWKLSLLLNIPLGTPATASSYVEARNSLEQARRELTRLQQQVLFQVRGALRRVETNLERAKTAQVETQLQRQKLEAEEQRFENQVSTTFEVLTYQNDMARSEMRLNRALVDYNTALLDLETVKGTLLQSRGIAVKDPVPRPDAGDADPSRVAVPAQGPIITPTPDPNGRP